MADIIPKIWQDSYQLFVNGKWIDAEGGKTFRTFNPANGEFMATCAAASKNDVDNAVTINEISVTAHQSAQDSNHFGVIYKLTNLINGKIYVGKTIQPLKRRLARHQRTKSMIGNAIRKYGWEKFKVEIIDVCNNLEQLNDREKYWIAMLKCLYPNGYNHTRGGDGGATTTGRKHTEETKRQMSISRKKYFAEHPEALVNLSVKNKGKTLTDTCKANISLANRGRKHTPESRANMSEGQRRRYENPIEHQKKSAEQKKRFENPEERRKMAEASRGRKQKPDAKIKLSKFRKVKVAFPVLEHEIESRKISRRGLASMLGVSHATVIAKLRGDKQMDLKTALKIREILNIDMTVEELFGESLLS